MLDPAALFTIFANHFHLPFQNFFRNACLPLAEI